MSHLGKIIISIGIGLMFADLIEHTVLGVKFNPKEIHHGYIGALLIPVGLAVHSREVGHVPPIPQA